MNRLFVVLIVFVLAAWGVASSLFMVDQRHYAIVFALGEVKRVVNEPGLYVKLPPPLQNVIFLDKRIQTIDSDSNKVTTAEQKYLLVDSFVKWRIVEPRTFYVRFSGDDSRALNRMSQIVNAAVKDEVNRHTVHEVISGGRAPIMNAIYKSVASEAKNIGVEIIDVRLKRVDYVDEIRKSVYERMKSERQRVANELRSTGAAESVKIRADADKQSTVILAEAYRDAEKIRGEGDAKASQIYADAFGQNPEFYKFYRSLEAYRASFKNRNDVMVIDSNSEFFKYFKNPNGGGNAAKK
jgi:membrane protease subunit HflC